MHKGSILVTPRSLSQNMHPALKPLQNAGYELLTPWPGRQPDAEELRKMLPGCVGYLAGVEKIPREVLQQALGLRVISRNGVGIDNIDLLAAKELGIIVKGTPGANSQGVAELAIALMFNAMRSVSWSCEKLKSGIWERKKGKEILGRTLGVVGCGQIGQRVIRMALGLGMQVVGYDVCQNPGLIGLQGSQFVGLPELLSLSDVITLHCPPAEKPLLDAKSLAMVKRGSIVINTARADVVDRQAMLKALEDGIVAHYATDVFSKEPPELDGLLSHEQVTLTPHIGGFTDESVERATEAAVTNLLDILEKGEPES